MTFVRSTWFKYMYSIIHLIYILIFYYLQFYPYGQFHGDSSLPEIFDSNSPEICLSDDFIFYGDYIRSVYVRMLMYHTDAHTKLHLQTL